MKRKPLAALIMYAIKINIAQVILLVVLVFSTRANYLIVP